MPGLVPGIHVFIGFLDVDGRDEPGHDESIGVIARHSRLKNGVAWLAYGDEAIQLFQSNWIASLRSQ